VNRKQRRSANTGSAVSTEQNFSVASAHLNAGRLDEAKRAFRQVLDEAPQHEKANYLLGAIYYHTRDFGSAEKYVGKALKQNGSDASYNLSMAMILRDAGKSRHALQYFAKAAEIDPVTTPPDRVANVFIHEARVELGRANISGAGQLFHQAIVISPEAVDKLYGENLAPMGREASAASDVAVLESILHHDKTNMALLEKLAYAQHLAGDISASQENFARIARSFEGDPESTHTHELYTAGLVATKTPASWRRRQRFFSLINTFDQVDGLPGDIAECGCARGLSAYVLASRQRDREPLYAGGNFHIFDSFAGLSEPKPVDVKDADERILPNIQKGAFANSLDTVRSHLAAFPDIHYYPGWIPTRFSEVEDLTFRFLNLDVDLYEPTRDSILFFYPRLVRGGLIVSDDYNWPGCRAAIEECRSKLGYDVELTANDQAIIRRN